MIRVLGWLLCLLIFNVYCGRQLWRHEEHHFALVVMTFLALGSASTLVDEFIAYRDRKERRLRETWRGHPY